MPDETAWKNASNLDPAQGIIVEIRCAKCPCLVAGHPAMAFSAPGFRSTTGSWWAVLQNRLLTFNSSAIPASNSWTSFSAPVLTLNQLLVQPTVHHPCFASSLPIFGSNLWLTPIHLPVGMRKKGPKSILNTYPNREIKWNNMITKPVSFCCIFLNWSKEITRTISSAVGIDPQISEFPAPSRKTGRWQPRLGSSGFAGSPWWVAPAGRMKPCNHSPWATALYSPFPAASARIPRALKVDFLSQVPQNALMTWVILHHCWGIEQV